MDTEENESGAAHRFFEVGCAVEGSLIFVGAFLCWLFGQGLLSNFHWNGRDALLGLGTALPPLGLFFWTVHSRWQPLRQIRRFLDELLLPIIKHWHVGQILLISLLAGLGEEFLFRGALQGGLTELVGEIPALILAGLIFGCCHPMSWGYLILTSVMGCYLGGLWLWTGNLLVPVILHAVYDFVALLYFRSRAPRSYK